MMDTPAYTMLDKLRIWQQNLNKSHIAQLTLVNSTPPRRLGHPSITRTIAQLAGKHEGQHSLESSLPHSQIHQRRQTQSGNTNQFQN